MTEAIFQNVKFSDKESCCFYNGVKIIDSELCSNVTVGEATYIRNSLLSDRVQINRRNLLINTSLGCCTFTGQNDVIKNTDIGKFCSISWNVSVAGGGKNHDIDKLSTHPFTKLSSFGFIDKDKDIKRYRTTIGNDVWIGMHSSINSGIKIGNGAIIGANSFVTSDIPDYAVVGGNPAKIIKYRFSKEIIEYLQAVKWWDWPIDILKDNISLFDSEMNLDLCRKLEKISSRLNITDS